MRKFGLAPVIDDKTEVLILGTLPSDVSLAKRQYYSNSNNDFWKIVGDVLDKNLGDLSYERRIEMLKAHAVSDCGTPITTASAPEAWTVTSAGNN